MKVTNGLFHARARSNTCICRVSGLVECRSCMDRKDETKEIVKRKVYLFKRELGKKRNARIDGTELGSQYEGGLLQTVKKK